MTQALYAHMNNKTMKKIFNKENVAFLYNVTLFSHKEE
jgi:hypothetical protein